MFMNKTEDEQNTEDGFSIEESKHEEGRRRGTTVDDGDDGVLR